MKQRAAVIRALASDPHVQVMSTDQGAIAHYIGVDLSRPRKRDRSDFQDQLNSLTRLLKNLIQPI